MSNKSALSFSFLECTKLIVAGSLDRAVVLMFRQQRNDAGDANSSVVVGVAVAMVGFSSRAAAADPFTKPQMAGGDFRSSASV